MIALSKLDGTTMYLNEDHVERVEQGANSAVYLTNGTYLIVRDHVDTINDSIRSEKAALLSAALGRCSGCGDGVECRAGRDPTHAKPAMTPIGILVALVAVVVSMTLDHGQVTDLIKIPAIILVLGGSLGATIAGFDKRRLRGSAQGHQARDAAGQPARHEGHHRHVAHHGQGGAAEPAGARAARDR